MNVGEIMSIEIKNTKTLATIDGFKFKALVYSVPGFGKTTFASKAYNPGFAACETGTGSGLISVAEAGVDYFEPTSYQDLEVFCSGAIFKDKETLVADSVTEMVRTFIKDYALSQVERKGGDSDKRRLGVPELDDYGTMGELTRRLLRKLLTQPKHIIVTALLAPYEPPVVDPMNSKNNRAERIGGPDLPGAMRLGSTAMFDIVLRGVLRPALRDPKDPKSRYLERIWVTEPDDKYIAKNRLSYKGKPIFPREVPFVPEKNLGTFDHLYTMFLDAHKEVTNPV